MIGAVSPAQPKIGPELSHSLGIFVGHFWWLILIVGGLALARCVAWACNERRLARSGINEIDRMDGFTFERRLAHLFDGLGYQVERTRARGDYGADLVVEKHGLRTVVQAKRWTKNVGVKAIQEAAAAKPMYRCDRAMVVTNRDFTQPARRLAAANEVDLWNRHDLVRELVRVERVRERRSALDTA